MVDVKSQFSPSWYGYESSSDTSVEVEQLSLESGKTSHIRLCPYGENKNKIINKSA